MYTFVKKGPLTRLSRCIKKWFGKVNWLGRNFHHIFIVRKSLFKNVAASWSQLNLSIPELRHVKAA